ncbi:ROK family transcriptional regulator [Aurantimonas sp. MSK8Z-1]|uniref:ROK family transcriptional regulator n=1 Tax=Mangrovibrevibacter kandeliae TaxID=2968473 RepID=UPI0021189DD6|nr:ROK family transcriptional regulator [Aurantimonas sp. MSK8Z-1]MCW4115075.1 ROK family transcriptional regulator [Aurantimonas sp. MSK8Z-1]
MHRARTQSELLAHTVDGSATGINQARLRAYNERTVLSLIRRHGSMAKADIARRTGLSPQTASVIMRELESAELVVRDTPQRGRVGQPSVPMRLNPDGAFALGMKVGRRSSEVMLMDFVGAMRERRHLAHAYPDVDELEHFAATQVRMIVDGLDARLRPRIAGLGVAMPLRIWEWSAALDTPPRDLDEWRGVDFVQRLERRLGLSVYGANDAMAACAAEHVFGSSGSEHFVYFYISSVAGGSIVIDGDIVPGRIGRAGALGAMPVPMPDGGLAPLADIASIHVLEAMLADAGRDARPLCQPDTSWDGLGDPLDRWLAQSGRALAHAVAAALSVYDFDTAIIDGTFPAEIRAALIEATRSELRRLRLRLHDFDAAAVRPGSIGPQARQKGSASLPFFARLLLDRRRWRRELR